MDNSSILPVSGWDRKKVAGSELADFFRKIRNAHERDNIVFLCIGTDRSTGDALGPLIGSRLMEWGMHRVIGSLQNPCDADNLEARMAEVRNDDIAIAIDACLGSPGTVGHYYVAGKPLIPAQSVGRNLPPVGHYSVAGIVNVKGPKPYWTLQVTSLYQVMTMAEEVAHGIIEGFRTDHICFSDNK